MSTATAGLLALNPDQVRSFHEDGFLHLRGAVERERIEGVRTAFARVADGMLAKLAAEGLIDGTHPELPFERRFAVAGAHAARFGRGWRKDVAGPEVFALHHAPRLVDAVQDLLGGDGVMGHTVYNARPKLPGQQLTVVPWHQDSGYFGAESARQLIITAWVPLVDVSPENGGLQVARGSHRYGLVDHRYEQREGQFLEIAAAEPRADVVVDVPMRIGDALLFGNLLWHRSLENRSDGVRWAIDLRFYGESLPGRAGSDEYPERWAVRSASRPPTPCETWVEWARNGKY
jgi:hypothetical protein